MYKCLQLNITLLEFTLVRRKATIIKTPNQQYKNRSFSNQTNPMAGDICANIKSQMIQALDKKKAKPINEYIKENILLQEKINTLKNPLLDLYKDYSKYQNIQLGDQDLQLIIKILSIQNKILTLERLIYSIRAKINQNYLFIYVQSDKKLSQIYDFSQPVESQEERLAKMGFYQFRIELERFSQIEIGKGQAYLKTYLQSIGYKAPKVNIYQTNRFQVYDLYICIGDYKLLQQRSELKNKISKHWPSYFQKQVNKQNYQYKSQSQLKKNQSQLKIQFKDTSSQRQTIQRLQKRIQELEKQGDIISEALKIFDICFLDIDVPIKLSKAHQLQLQNMLNKSVQDNIFIDGLIFCTQSILHSFRGAGDSPDKKQCSEKLVIKSSNLSKDAVLQRQQAKRIFFANFNSLVHSQNKNQCFVYAVSDLITQWQKQIPGRIPQLHQQILGKYVNENTLQNGYYARELLQKQCIQKNLIFKRSIDLQQASSQITIYKKPILYTHYISPSCKYKFQEDSIISGLIRPTRQQKFDCQSHSAVIVGLNQHQNYWIVKNSWGNQQAYSGYFKIDKNQKVVQYSTAYYNQKNCKRQDEYRKKILQQIQHHLSSYMKAQIELIKQREDMVFKLNEICFAFQNHKFNNQIPDYQEQLRKLKKQYIQRKKKYQNIQDNTKESYQRKLDQKINLEQNIKLNRQKYDQNEKDKLKFILNYLQQKLRNPSNSQVQQMRQYKRYIEESKRFQYLMQRFQKQNKAMQSNLK